MDKSKYNIKAEVLKERDLQRSELYKKFNKKTDFTYAFRNKEQMSDALSEVRKSKETIKDSHWLRPDNHNRKQ